VSLNYVRDDFRVACYVGCSIYTTSYEEPFRYVKPYRRSICDNMPTSSHLRETAESELGLPTLAVVRVGRPNRTSMLRISGDNMGTRHPFP